MKKIFLFSFALMLGMVAVAAEFDGSSMWTITSGGTYEGSTYNKTSNSGNNATVIAQINNPFDTLFIRNVTFENKWNSNSNWSVFGVYKGTVVLENCTIHNYGTGLGVKCAGGTLILKNCDVTVDLYRGYASAAVQAQTGIINIYGGNYTSIYGAALEVNTSGGTINVYDGTFTCYNTELPYVNSPNASANLYCGAVFCDKTGVVNIYDGVFNGAIFCKNEYGAQVNIYGGDFTAKTVIGNQAKPATFVARIPTKAIFFDGVVYKNKPADYIYAREMENIYTTVCFDHKPTWSNGKFYSIAYRNYNKVYCDELALADLVAGKPYIFVSEEDSAKFKFNPDTLASDIIASDNGLISAYEGINYNYETQTVISATDTKLVGYFVIYNDYMAKGKQGDYLLTNRAYIDGAAISTTPVVQPEGMDRIVFGLEGEPSDPTGIKAINANAVKAEKVIVNGKVYIRRNGQLFSVLGNAAE